MGMLKNLHDRLVGGVHLDHLTYAPGVGFAHLSSLLGLGLQSSCHHSTPCLHAAADHVCFWANQAKYGTTVSCCQWWCIFCHYA